jgi:aspartate racemase
MKNIIIIGGMGPQASHNLHGRLLTRAANLGARDGDEFPEIIHLSLPIKDFISDPSAMAEASAKIVRALSQPYFWQRS